LYRLYRVSATAALTCADVSPINAASRPTTSGFWVAAFLDRVISVVDTLFTNGFPYRSRINPREGVTDTARI
jgi:hypothetical protein